MTKLSSLSLILLLALCSCGFAAEGDWVRFIESAKAAQKVVVYGGNGFSCRQPQKIDLERHVSKGDHFFLKTAHELKEEPAKTVLDIFSKRDGLTELQGPKPGTTAFAPDLCIEWTVDGKATLVLVSFYTCEVKASGPDFKLHCDFRGRSHEVLRGTLSLFIPSSPMDE